MTQSVSITYRTAEILAGLLPGRHKYLTNEAQRAIVEFLGQVVRTRNLIDAEQETDPDT